jgi:hypothetical protein
MLKNYTLESILTSGMTEENILSFCRQLNGDAGTLSYCCDEDENIAYGDFNVHISNKDLLKLDGCMKYFITSDPSFIGNKETILDFKCIVIEQKSQKIACVNMSNPENKYVFTVPLEQYDPTQVLLVFFQRKAGYELDYMISLNPEDMPMIACLFDNLPVDDVSPPKRNLGEFSLN